MDSIIVVTSDYHSARTASAFRQLLKNKPIVMMVQPSQEQVPDLNSWWKDRYSARGATAKDRVFTVLRAAARLSSASDSGPFV